MVHFWRVFHRWLPGDPFSEGKPPVIFIVHFEPIILFLRRRHFKKDVTGFKIGQLKTFEKHFLAVQDSSIGDLVTHSVTQ